MVRLLVRWLLNALALLLIAELLSSVHITFVAALVAAVVIGAINTFVRPLLVLLTLPITILTLGLFLLVLNALLFWLASALVPGFSIHGFLTALLASILYSILTTIISWATRTPSEKRSARAA